MTEVSATSPEAFEIPCKDGLSIRGEVYPAAPSLGTVIVCHGFKGFAHWGFFPYLGRTLAENGLTAITFDFSGSGIGPDRESFTEPGAFAGNTLSREQDDLENLVDYAKRMKLITGKKFGLFGHSRGGGSAILFAAAPDSDVSSLVTWAAISFPNRWSKEDVEQHGKTKLNIEAAAAKIKVPWLIVHGTADDTVPSTEAERLHALSSGVSTLRLIKGANHGFDAKHPLTEVPPVLEKVVLETVKFFVRNATAK